MAVPDELPGFVPGVGKSQPIDQVVQATFQEDEEVGPGDALHPFGFFEEVPELILQYPVHALDPLFLPQLEAVVGELDPALAVLSRRVGPAIDGAFVGITPLPFEVEL
jgi:hypothetical protein